MQLKRKSDPEDYEGGSSEWTATTRYAEAVNSPLSTPVSGKGGRNNSRSKVSKYSKSGPQTPVSNAGEEYCILSCRHHGTWIEPILNLDGLTQLK